MPAANAKEFHIGNNYCEMAKKNEVIQKIYEE
jgi:hypothetical protein